MWNEMNGISSWQYLIKRLIFLWLAVCMTGVSACTNPKPPASPVEPKGVQASTETPIATQAVSVPATPVPQEALPPALVEIQPPAGSELPLKGELTFYFNQPMQRATVEKAVLFNPDLPGRFDWLDDQTVKFTPQQPLLPDTPLTVAINTSALAVNGKGMLQPLEIPFRVVKSLHLVERLPKPDSMDVDPAGAIVVTFSQPVTPLTADSKDFPAAFKLEPSASGRGEWVNTSTYVYYPEPPLLGGKTYKVSLNQQISSSSGAGLSPGDVQKASWSFSTALPKLVSITPDGSTPVALDQTFELKFNQAMEHQSVENNLELRGSNAELFPGKFTWDAGDAQVSFHPENLLPRGMALTLALSGKAVGRAGTPLAKDFSQDYRSTYPMAVAKTSPTANKPMDASNGYGSVIVEFTAPLGKQDLSELVSIQPPIDDFQVYAQKGEKNMTVSGIFQMSASYTLTISSSLKDVWEQSLGRPFILDFKTGDARPTLAVPILMAGGGSALFMPPQETALPAKIVNLANLQISSASLTLAQFSRLAENYKERDAYQPEQRTSWQVEFSGQRNLAKPVELPLSSNGKPLPTGLYYFQMRNPVLEGPGRYAPSPFLMVVSRVQLTLKRSAKAMFVWAVNLEDNTPLANLPLILYDPIQGAPLFTCNTDEKGTCEMPLPPGKHEGAYYVVSGQPGDQFFALASDDWTAGVSGWNYGISNYIRESSEFIYLYSDRPIYRPGQTVNFRAIVREEENGRYSLGDLKQIDVKAVGDYSADATPWQKVISVPLDSFGTGWGSFTLPESAAPGYYSLSVEDKQATSLSFQVAEYRKPQIDLQVKTDTPNLLSGQSFKAAVKALYYFGAPAANQEVSWTLYAAREPFNMQQGFQTGKEMFGGEGDFGFSELGGFLQEGKGKTNADGVLTLDIPLELPNSMDGEVLQRLTLEATIQDESNYPVSSRDTALLHPAKFYIGVHPENWSGQAGKEMGFGIQTVDWERAASPNHTLKASFQKITWKQQSVEDWNVITPPAKPVYSEISSVDFKTDEKGQARLAFTPADPGSYRLQISGEGAVVEISLWVGGSGSVSWQELPDQHITLEKDAVKYQPGQTAHIFIPNPFEKGALALMTVERGRVMRSQVVNILGANYDFSLPLLEGDAPNIYISVLLLSKRTDGTQDFRQGYINLEVEPAVEILNVKLTPGSERAYPASEARFAIEVTDHQGKPVQGEFSLALVDKAIFALADANAPKIMDAFYGIQPLGVISALSMAVYGGRIPYMPVGGRGGGGGNGPVPIRQEFKDTAYWNATIITDANGKAEITMKLPDNLTTWVATLRGISADSGVGETEQNLVVSKDLLVSPVTPRFLVVGDHVELAAVVHNNTANSLSVDVSLEAQGVALDDPTQGSQRIELGAGQQHKVFWWGKALDVEKADLVFGAKSGDLQDLTKPEQGSLPVLHYASPETFATSGILEEGGERLELVSLPHSFKPTGGELQVEMTPSIAGIILGGLKGLETFPTDYTEAVLSRLLPNVATYQVLKDLKVENPALKQQLEGAVQDGIVTITRTQNRDGGWGWAQGMTSNNYLSAYALLGLKRAEQAGFLVDIEVERKARNYLIATLMTPEMTTQDWQMERMVFILYAIQESGTGNPGAMQFYQYRERLNPWARALLMLTLKAQNPGSPEAIALQNDLESGARRMATGAYWEEIFRDSWNWSTPNFNTAVVVYALEKVNPSSQAAKEAVRYLVAHRQACNCWSSSYESAWVLAALVEALKTSGDLRGIFNYSASLNGNTLAEGKAEGTRVVQPVSSSVPLSNLLPQTPNALRFKRDAGDGNLYYRAALQVHRPVEGAPAVQRGLTLTRRYQQAGQTCKEKSCPTINTIQSGEAGLMMQVRLSLIVPDDMYYVVVEDNIPAGTEILNTQLKSSQQGVKTQESEQPQYDPQVPFMDGWGWWYFNSPQVYDDHIRWMAEYLPAGSYELTYKLLPLQAGEYRLIPARAYPNYFPEVEGGSEGGVLTILP